MDTDCQSPDSNQPPYQGPKQLPANPRRRMYRTHCLLAPRAYEEIYHERAYLSTYLQQKTRRIEGLIKEYSETQAELQAGAEGKTRRRLRKLLNLLRCKLDEASEQERAIFSRLGELYMELNCRNAWEQARKLQPVMPKDGSQAPGTAEEGSPSTSVTPVTPCPSFASSDWSAASLAPVASPVATTDPGFADAAHLPEYHDLYSLPRCLASEYLETVPEELESAAKTPPEPGEPAGEDGSLTPPPWQGFNREPEFGALEYDYVQYKPLEVEQGRKSADDGTSGSVPLKGLVKSPSLPGMQFSWPDV